MSATTAPQARAAIITILNAWPALSGVQITSKGPTRAEGTDPTLIYVAPEMVYLGRVRMTQDWAALGNRQRKEDYTIGLHIRIWKQAAATTELQADDRIWAIWRECSLALTANPSLGVILSGGNAQIGDAEQDSHATLEPVGWQAWIDSQIHVTARLRLT